MKVLDEVGESRNFIKVLENRVKFIIGHQLKHNEFVTNIIKAKVRENGEEQKYHEYIKHYIRKQLRI